MGLFDFFKKKPVAKANLAKPKIKVEMHGYVDGVEVPLSESEGNDRNADSFSTMHTISTLIAPKERKISQIASSLGKGMDTDTQIAVLSELIKAFYELKDYCVTLGSEYEDYFSRTWEHCHNSKCADFCYISRYEKQLDQIQQNYVTLKEKDTAYMQNVKDLKPRVLDCIRDNPGILQTELYKRFDASVKTDIQEILYYLSKDGLISRQKKGNTYELNLK